MRMEQYLTFTDHALWELARKNELKAKSTLMLAIPDEHLLKFHACKNTKSLWEAIKNRFGGNKESKKMQNTILKQNYENFAASSQEGLDKTYDRFQKLINTLSMDDLYNNLNVYESEIKTQSSSSLNSHNVAFVSSDNSSSTNETVNTAHSVSAASSKDQASTASYADDVMFSFFSNQSNALQLDNKDLEQIDTDDLEEMDLKWQVAMLTMRVKRRGHFARECRAPRNQENRNRDALTRNTPVDTSTTNALHIHLKVHQVQTLRNQIGLESLEARIVVHEKNKVVYEEDNAFLKFDVQVKDISIKEIKNQIENALKEKDDLKLKLEKFETSSKNLTKLINSQISAIDKTGLGYDGKMNESDLNDIHVNESEVLNNVVDIVKVMGMIIKVRDIMQPPRADLSFAGLDNFVFKSKESDSKDENVFNPKEVKKTVKPSLENIKFFNARNTTVENENKAEKPRKFSQSLGGKITGPKEIRPVWDNTARVNHQNKLTHPHPKRNFVPDAVLTKSRQVPVNAAKQSSHRAAASVSAARRVSTAASRPNVNNALPTTYSYFKAHSPVRRPFNQKSTAKTNNFNEKVNIAKVNNVTTAGPKAVDSVVEGN
nr:hypothetical protein [Tanacetum cinerariifolium]